MQHWHSNSEYRLMAFTFTPLKSAIQDYLETTETTFVNDLPTIITQAEERILKSVQLPDFRKNANGTTTQSNPYLSVPSDFLATYSLSIDNSGYEFLIRKDVNFIREAYPVASTTGVPKHYALFNEQSFILGQHLMAITRQRYITFTSLSQ